MSLKKVQDENISDVKRKQDEKVAVAQNILEVVEMYARKLNSDLTVYEAHLRSTGRFEEQGADPGREVAIKPEAHISEWILGRVIFYHSDTGYYDIADVDDSKRYHLPENQVIVLDLVDSTRKLSKGEEVLAIYPETTSFYPAVVSVAPRRTAISTEPTVSVQVCAPVLPSLSRSPSPSFHLSPTHASLPPLCSLSLLMQMMHNILSTLSESICEDKTYYILMHLEAESSLPYFPFHDVNWPQID